MRKFIDRDGRVFGLISVVDLLVLVFLVLAGVSLYLKFHVLDTTETVQNQDLSSMDTISVQVLVPNVSDFVADALAVGDEVYDQGNFDAGVLGTIADIQIQDASYVADLSNGLRAVVSGAEDHCNVLLTLECRYTESNGFYMINGDYPLGVNVARTFFTKYASFSGTVLQVG